MIIIGCDHHPGFEQIAFVDTETEELQERRLQHREEAEKFWGIRSKVNAIPF
jgi:transposase